MDPSGGAVWLLRVEHVFGTTQRKKMLPSTLWQDKLKHMTYVICLTPMYALIQKRKTELIAIRGGQ